jgi:aspartyl-tRNA(Asn)/glutamyl-tRNA(Gln) amidotransferase subunit A
MTDLTRLTIKELKQGLASRSFSAVEVTSAYLKEIESAKELNAFITVASEDALKEAQAVDDSGGSDSCALNGIPIALKDIILTKGIRSTCASKILHNFIPPYDATVTSKLKSAGAVMLGKTNLDEFAMGSSTENSAFGVTKNPWNTSKVSGGSSGGSAACVAAGLAPAALGTDTGGSIRQPASFCGVTGIRPTYGRVSRYGVIAYASSLDQVGVFARTAEDCAVVLAEIAGHDPYDSTSSSLEVPSFVQELEKDIKGLRIGIPKEYFGEGIMPEVRERVEAGIATLEALGATTVPVSLPHTDVALAAYYIIAPAEASSNLARYDGIRYGYRSSEVSDLFSVYEKSRSEGFGPEVKRRIMIGTYVLSSGYYDAYYIKAQKARALVAQDFTQAFETSCDIIAAPVAPTPAFGIGENIDDPLKMYLNDILTIPINMAGLPAMSVPCGLTSDNLPVGLQLIGKSFDESTLLRVAHRFQCETTWHSLFPERSWNSKQ